MGGIIIFVGLMPLTDSNPKIIGIGGIIIVFGIVFLVVGNNSIKKAQEKRTNSGG